MTSRYSVLAALSLLCLASSCEISVNSGSDDSDESKKGTNKFSYSDEYKDHLEGLRDENKLEDAIAYIDSLMAIYPDDVIYLKDRGIVRTDLGDYEGSEKDFLAVIEKDSGFGEVFISLGYLSMIKGDIDAADSLTIIGLELTPESSMGHMNLGVFNMRRQGDIMESYNHFRKAIELDDENSMAYNNIGYIHMINGGNDSAFYYYDKALEYDQSNMTALNNRIGINSTEENHDAVLEDLLELYAIDSSDITMHRRLCFAYYALDQNDLALQWGQKAVQSEPESIQAAINYGYALMKDEQLDAACEQFTRFDFEPNEELKEMMKRCDRSAS